MSIDIAKDSSFLSSKVHTILWVQYYSRSLVQELHSIIEELFLNSCIHEKDNLKNYKEVQN